MAVGGGRLFTSADGAGTACPSRERDLPIARMASSSVTKAGPGVKDGADVGPDDEEQRYEPPDPEPDSDDDFEGDDGGRQSEEAIPDDDD